MQIGDMTKERELLARAGLILAQYRWSDPEDPALRNLSQQINEYFEEPELAESATTEPSEIYNAMTNLDWELYEDLPALGLITLRKNMSAIPDFYSWAYVTIDKKGNLINGKPTRFKQHCWQQND